MRDRMFSREEILRIAKLNAVESRRCSDGVMLELLYRDAAEMMQIERITIPSNSFIAPHSHPDVSTYEYGVSGSGLIVVAGHRFYSNELVPPSRAVPVKRGAVHSGLTGTDGATVLAVQFWHRGKMTTIADNWQKEN